MTMTETDPAARHEEWILDIRKQLEAYAKLRQQVRYFPLFGVLTAPFGFFVSPFVALLILVAWLSIWATTL